MFFSHHFLKFDVHKRFTVPDDISICQTKVNPVSCLHNQAKTFGQT